LTPIRLHHRRIDSTANSEVSWSVPTLTQPRSVLNGIAVITCVSMVARRALRILTLSLIVAVLGAPISDIFAFGLHDHVAGAEGDPDTGHLGRSENDGVHTAHHHCELSMNPAEVIDICGPATPGPDGHLALRPTLLTLHSVPFIPQLPPRR
jgi:hypothetical protein